MHRLRTAAVRYVLCPWVSVCLAAVSFTGVIGDVPFQEAQAQDEDSQASTVDLQPRLSPATAVVWNVLEHMQVTVLRVDRTLRISHFLGQAGEALLCIIPVRLLSSAQPLGP